MVFFFVLARSQGHKKVLRCRLTDIWSEENNILLSKAHLTIAPEMKGKWLIIWVHCLSSFFLTIRREAAQPKSNNKDEGQLKYCCTNIYKENSSNVFWKIKEAFIHSLIKDAKVLLVADLKWLLLVVIKPSRHACFRQYLTPFVYNLWRHIMHLLSQRNARALVSFT